MKYTTSKIYLFLFPLILSSRLFSQDWPKVFGDNIDALGYEITEYYDLGFAICGSIMKDASHFKYGWLIKTDINGNILWDKKFGDASYENSFWDFEITTDQGLIISGATAQQDIEIDPLFVKLNPCGEIEWCKIYLSEGFNTAQGIITLPNGEHVGLLQYYGGDYQNIRISLVKMDATGEPIWIKHLAQEDSTIFNEEGYDLYLTPDSNYLISGRCFCPSKKPFFIKTDTSGEELWDIKWPVGSGGWADESVFSSNGLIYSATGLQFSGHPRKPYLLKFNQNGVILDQYALMSDTIEGGGAETLLLVDDTSMFVGLTWSDDPTFIEAYSDILRTDTLGNKIYQRRLIDDSFPPTSIIKSFDNKILVIGIYGFDGNWDIYMWKMNEGLIDDTLYTQPMTYDSLCPYQITSDTLDLDCGLFVNMDEIPTKEEYESTINISPNPARDWTLLSMPDNIHDGMMDLAIYNLFGEEILKKEVTVVNRTITVNISSLSKGLYVAICKDRQNRVLKGKFIVVGK